MQRGTQVNERQAQQNEKNDQQMGAALDVDVAGAGGGEADATILASIFEERRCLQHGQARSTVALVARLVLLTKSLDVRFAVGIEEFFAA